MMKPDLKVTIAWGADDQLEFAKAIKNRLDEMRKQGYPVDAQIVFSTGDGEAITQRVEEVFSNFDYAIFLLCVKSMNVTPLEKNMISIPKTCDFGKMLGEMLKNNANIFPQLSQNVIYELGIANATHKNSDSILWFFSGGNFHKDYLPTDINKPAVYSLDDQPTMDLQINYILTKLHEKVYKTFNYLGQSYKDKITPILFQSDYHPNLEKIISNENLININFLSSYNSPLDEYFKREYSLFNQENIKYNLDCRIQYFIDRAVFFVYLRNHELWVQSVGQLSDAVESLLDKDSSYYFVAKLAINVLSNVMIYHRMMIGQEASLELLYEKFKKYSEDRMLKNSMLRCLCFDYKGLCAHKIALNHLAAAIGKESFQAISKADINSVINSSEIEKKERAKEYLQTAKESFDEVLRISDENSMGDVYLWDEFALYNKARCEYLLSIIFNSSSTWKRDMTETVRIRRQNAEKYGNISSFPVVISHNLKAEYYLSKLEQYFYSINSENSYIDTLEFEDIKRAILVWEKESSLYTDVLSVKNKLLSLESFIKKLGD